MRSPLAPFRPMTGRRRSRTGQSLVEFAVLVPIFLVILLGMLEFGFVFSHHVTLEYATREGARAGAAMADGSPKDAQCLTGQLTSANVDPLVIAAVQRVLTSPGSMVDLTQISQIRLYEVTSGGTITGLGNVWRYRPNDPANPPIPCQTPTQLLDFYELSSTWPASSRTTGTAPDSIGVSIAYTYQFKTPLSGILRLIGGGSASVLQMSDQTVMALQPTL
jgi:TadE-like protein